MVFIHNIQSTSSKKVVIENKSVKTKNK